MDINQLIIVILKSIKKEMTLGYGRGFISLMLLFPFVFSLDPFRVLLCIAISVLSFDSALLVLAHFPF